MSSSFDLPRGTIRLAEPAAHGSPCRTPLLHLNSFPTVPFMRTEEVAEDRRSCAHWIHFSGNPLALNICSTTTCSIRSKAFSKSNFRMMISLLDWWQWCKYSKAHPKQSWIVLPLTNPYWFWWTTSIETPCNLFARSLDTIFGEVFRRDIGQKSLTVSGFSIFGTRVIKE